MLLVLIRARGICSVPTACDMTYSTIPADEP
jgi:hypothetical protein